jgi:hypothetical protein
MKKRQAGSDAGQNSTDCILRNKKLTENWGSAEYSQEEQQPGWGAPGCKPYTTVTHFRLFPVIASGQTIKAQRQRVKRAAYGKWPAFVLLGKRVITCKSLDKTLLSLHHLIEPYANLPVAEHFVFSRLLLPGEPGSETDLLWASSASSLKNHTLQSYTQILICFRQVVFSMLFAARSAGRIDLCR